jgi:hypothetical protein
VLRFASGLSESQVAQVLDAAPGSGRDLVARALARVDLAAVRETSP